MKICNYIYYVLLSLFGLPHFPIPLAEPTQILLSEVVFPQSILQSISNNAQAWQAFPLFMFSGWSLLASACDEAKIVLWRQGSERAGENADLLFSLAVTSATNPPNSPLPLQLTAPSHIALLFFCVKSVCAWSSPRACKQLQMQNKCISHPGWPREAPAGPAWGYICTGAIPSCFLPQNQHIVHQNHEVQKGLLALESREKNPAIKPAFSWFLLSSSVITQL